MLHRGTHIICSRQFIKEMKRNHTCLSHNILCPMLNNGSITVAAATAAVIVLYTYSLPQFPRYNRCGVIVAAAICDVECVVMILESSIKSKLKRNLHTFNVFCRNLWFNAYSTAPLFNQVQQANNSTFATHTLTHHSINLAYDYKAREVYASDFDSSLDLCRKQRMRCQKACSLLFCVKKTFGRVVVLS